MKYYDNYGRVHDRLFDALASNLGEGAKKFIQPKEPEIEEEVIIDSTNENVSDVNTETSSESTSISDEIINADPIMFNSDKYPIKYSPNVINSTDNGTIQGVSSNNIIDTISNAINSDVQG